MKFSKHIFIGAAVLLFALGGAFAAAPAAHAQDDCGITTADIDQIAATESNPALSASQELSAELALRRQLVGQTITCAEGEVTELQAALAAASTTDPVGMSVQSRLAGDLNDATNYYNLELQKLGTAGIAGTEAIAQEVLAWRGGTFAPLSENVSNFILWSENQNLFDTAQTRMDETQRAVSFLESNEPDSDLQSAFDSTAASFSDAESQNAAAGSALAGDVSPDQSIALIKQSLTSLSAAYQGFFTVSNLIQGILPQ